jgi:glutamate-1-semialdehyde 2,1-aminomutase
MLSRGISLAPSQFEANFISTAHSRADVDATAKACVASLETAFA